MRKSHDFSKGVKNPYASRLKQQVTIRLAKDTITYFKAQSEQTGMPYQSLIDLYLSDCARQNKKLTLHWS
jgi:predicted DNA binding CopG/RHH family protein